MSGEDLGPSEFSQIVEKNFSVDPAVEGALRYLGQMVEVALHHRFNGNKALLNGSRTEAAESLVDAKLASTMEEGLSLFDIACQRRIRDAQKDKNGEA
jgi:hypothetical protein